MTPEVLPDEAVEAAARAAWSHCVGHTVDDAEWAAMRDVEIPAMRAGRSAVRCHPYPGG
jgi:hypothetical protein